MESLGFDQGSGVLVFGAFELQRLRGFQAKLSLGLHRLLLPLIKAFVRAWRGFHGGLEFHG